MRTIDVRAVRLWEDTVGDSGKPPTDEELGTFYRAAKAEAFTEAAWDPAARLGGHSGVSVRWLRARASELEADGE